MRPYPIISADSHFTEPADLWQRYIEPEFRDRAPACRSTASTPMWSCATAVSMFPVGVMHGVRWKGGETPTDGRYADIPASGWRGRGPHRRHRTRRRARRGAVSHSGHALLHHRRRRPSPAQCSRAYNTFAADFCREHPDRFKAVAVIPLDDLGQAIDELHRAHGARARRGHDLGHARRQPPPITTRATTRSGPPPKSSTCR